MVIMILIVLGLCFGSFVNALVWRVHEQELVQEKLGSQNNSYVNKIKLRSWLNDLSIRRGRSMCVNCRHTLSWYDLVPVISWVSLKAKCRYCKRKIAVQYPVVEIVTAFLLAISYIYWPQEFDVQGTFNFTVWAITLIGFMALIVYDLRWFILPNRIVFPLIALATLQTVVNFAFLDANINILFNALFAALIGGGIFYVLYQVSHAKWIGGGDVKLGFALGIIVGTPLLALLLLLLASIIGIIFSLPTLLAGKANIKTEIPFGPSLILSSIILVLIGQDIANWYLKMLQI